MSENNKGSLALKERLAQRKEMVEQEKAQGELDAMPKSRAEAVLVRMESTLQGMLPATMSQEKAAKLVNNTIQLIRKKPELAACGPSLMGGVLTSAQLGLELGIDALGEAYLLPFKKSVNVGGKWEKQWEATLIIGYKGYRKLAWQSGMIRDISRHVVYENDDFFVEYGSDERIRHRPAEGERGAVKGFYAVVSLQTGGKPFKYMDLAEMEAHRDAYAMAKKRDGTIVGPWRDNFVEMALKTVLLKTLRDCPLSVEDKMLAASLLDGSVRRDTSKDYSDTGDILNASQLTQAFNPNGLNVVEGETVPDYEEDDIEDAETEEEPPATPEPAKAEAAPVQGQSDRQFVAQWAQENGESLLDTLAAASGVVHDAPGDYTDDEIAVAANALRIPQG